MVVGSVEKMGSQPSPSPPYSRPPPQTRYQPKGNSWGGVTVTVLVGGEAVGGLKGRAGGSIF